MAQGMLGRVVKEANTPAADPSEFNAKLRAIEKQLYGIETSSLSRLRQAREMQDRRIKLKHGQDYRPISLDALRTFRTVEGWPAIAIFSLSHPRFEISLAPAPYRPIPTASERLFKARKVSDTVKITPDLPPGLAECFDDVVLKLSSRVMRDFDGYSRMDGPLVLVAEYTGLVPFDIKEKIIKAKPHFSEIFILAEPVGWSLKKPALLPPDPIVVGWDGKGLYFIAEYDTTPVEDGLLLEGPGNKQK
jgi:hypothetical protein